MNENVISASTAYYCKEREIIGIFYVNIYLLERKNCGDGNVLTTKCPCPYVVRSYFEGWARLLS